MALVVQFIHDAEEKAISKDYNVTGVQKKQWVTTAIRTNIPEFYNQHELLIDTMIDSLILIGNNPTVILAQKRLEKSFCCN
jgi:hypothetical protein